MSDQLRDLRVERDTFEDVARFHAQKAERLEAELAVVRGREAQLRAALEAIARNAESWHGNGEEGPRRALAVIARWARDPASIPAGVLDASPAAEEKP